MYVCLPALPCGVGCGGGVYVYMITPPPRDGHGHVCRCIYLYVHRSLCMYVSPLPPVGWGVVAGCMYT